MLVDGGEDGALHTGNRDWDGVEAEQEAEEGFHLQFLDPLLFLSGEPFSLGTTVLLWVDEELSLGDHPPNGPGWDGIGEALLIPKCELVFAVPGKLLPERNDVLFLVGGDHPCAPFLWGTRCLLEGTEVALIEAALPGMEALAGYAKVSSGDRCVLVMGLIPEHPLQTILGLFRELQDHSHPSQSGRTIEHGAGQDAGNKGNSNGHRTSWLVEIHR